MQLASSHTFAPLRRSNFVRKVRTLRVQHGLQITKCGFNDCDERAELIGGLRSVGEAKRGEDCSFRGYKGHRHAHTLGGVRREREGGGGE